MEWKPIALHVLAGLLALMFLMAGSGKLMGDPMYIESYTRWGYPLWFIATTGSIEALAAIGTAIPATRFYGASVLVAVMFGATATHVINAEWTAIAVTLVLGSLALFLAYVNRPERLGGAGAAAA